MSRTLTLLGYAVLVTAAVGVELAARRRRRSGSGSGTGTFGDTLDAALRRPFVRPLLLAGWLWLGWHLFVRVDWD